MQDQPVEDLSDRLSSQESDEDAEGEPDDDFDVPVDTNMDEEESDDEADSHSTRPGKRKKAVEEEEYMMKDPELYGLRRSVRATSDHRRCCSADHLVAGKGPSISSCRKFTFSHIKESAQY